MSETGVVTWRTYAGLFLVTLATLMYEILLTRIFSVTMFYHFAFIALSVAMFGMTVGALIVYLKPGYFTEERAPRQLAVFALLFGISIVFSFLTQLVIPFAVHPSITWLYGLALWYAVLALPFVLSGICVSIALTRFPRHVSRLYAADLTGAALGCLLVVAVLAVTDGPTAVLSVALLASLGALFFLPPNGGRSLRRLTRGSVASLAVVVSLEALLAANQTPLLRIMWVKGKLEPPPLYEVWNSFSRVTVIGDPEKNNAPVREPFGWGLSRSCPVAEAPAQLGLFIDAAAGTVLTQFDGDTAPLGYLKCDITNLVHYIRTGSRVFLVGAGGGRDILSALTFGQASITAAEINGNIMGTVNGRFGDFTGHLDRNPRVRFVRDEARSYLARDRESYDAIQISFIDTWAATASGAFVLTEHQLYTQEAFSIFMQRLAPKGVLSVSRYYFEGLPGEMYRLTALAKTALGELGVTDVRSHLVVAKIDYDGTPWWSPTPLPPGVGVGTILVSREPFTDRDLDVLEDVARKMGFELVFTPRRSTDPNFTAIARATDLRAFAAKFPLDISPPTDDTPFFFQMLHLRDVLSPASWLQGANTVNMVALFLLAALLCVVLGMTFLCIVVPLFLTRKRVALGGSGALFVFFGAIGLGFMLIEVAQLQRLTVLLGNPTYGLTVVLFTLLLSAGLGSYATERWDGTSTMGGARWALLAIPVTLLVFGALTPVLVRSSYGLGVSVRIAVAVAVTFPMGLVLGTAFPLGMKLAAGRAKPLMPWLWGINGAASVSASVLGVTIALVSSISTAFLTGVFCYVAALAAFLVVSRSAPREASAAETVSAAGA